MIAQDRLVTVYSLNDPIEADLIRNLLIKHDIACSLDGEHQAGFTGFLPINVLVFANDEDRASKVLKKHHVALPPRPLA